METLIDYQPVGGRACRVAATERGDGDVHPFRTAAPTLAARQVRAIGTTWLMVDQVHGVDVVDLGDRPDDAAARRSRADVLAADDAAVPFGIWAADCAPLALLGRNGAVVLAHGGWRGLAAGVIDVAVATIRARGDVVATAVLGPTVGPCCYEFGERELEHVATGVGVPVHELRAATASGAASLDVPAAVAAALTAHDVGLDVVAGCTACDERWFSHRRGDLGRHAVVVFEPGDR